MKNLVALLPIKKNSERVPNKNFIDFKGKPLFRWTLDNLLLIDEIDQIVINTDAIEILNRIGLPNSDKILIRERRIDLCGDLISMNKIIQNDLMNINAKHYLMTHTTNPLISSNTFLLAIKTYFNSLEKGFDSVFSVNKYQSRFYDAKLNPINHKPENLVRTQDLEPLFEENSCIYLFNKQSFNFSLSRIGQNPIMYNTPFYESVDIDDYETLARANIYYKFLNDYEI